MKKYNGISLIETLISLTILGISLIALLPVTTVRKDGNDPSLGNRYWLHSGDDVKYEYSVNVPYSIAPDEFSDFFAHIRPVNPETTDSLNVALGSKEVSNSFLHLGTSGFQNKDLIPLYVASELRWNGQFVEGRNGHFFLRGGTDDDSVGDSSGKKVYPRNVYIDNNIVVVENAQTANPSFSFSRDGVVKKSGVRASNSFYSLEHNVGLNEDDHIEFLVNDVTNNVIGIGKNASKYYTGQKFIGIMNLTKKPADLVASNEMQAGVSAGDEGGLIIGAKNTAGLKYDDSSQFYIYKPNNSNFTFNARTVNVQSLSKVSQILVSSDERLKNVLGDYKNSIDTILKIKPVVFSWKKDETNKEQVGIIAQDLQKIIPNAVSKNNQTGYLVISTDPIFYAIINSIKDLNLQNQELENENKKLEEKIAKLKQIRDGLKASQGGNNEK